MKIGNVWVDPHHVVAIELLDKKMYIHMDDKRSLCAMFESEKAAKEAYLANSGYLTSMYEL